MAGGMTTVSTITPSYRSQGLLIWSAIDTYNFEEFKKQLEHYLKSSSLEDYKKAVNSVIASGLTPYEHAYRLLSAMKLESPSYFELQKIVTYLRDTLGGKSPSSATPKVRAMSTGDIDPPTSPTAWKKRTLSERNLADLAEPGANPAAAELLRTWSKGKGSGMTLAAGGAGAGAGAKL